MRDCQDPGNMALGDLCEADGAIAGFPQANTINNCGNEDVFRLTSCDNDDSSLICTDDEVGLYISSYGLLRKCEEALDCGTILNSASGTTIANYCGETCRNCHCSSGTIFVNADISYPALDNGEMITLMCPHGFLGNVQIQCDSGSPIVSYGTCVVDLWTRADSPRPTQQPTVASSAKPTKAPYSVTGEVVTLSSANESKGIHPAFLYIACTTSVLLLILCVINLTILLRNNGYLSGRSKAEDEKRPAIISIAPEYIHQHGIDGEDEIVGGEGLVESEDLLEVDELPEEPIRPVTPVAVEVSVPMSALKHQHSSRSVSISRPWWASRSRPRNSSQFSLASSMKSNQSHKSHKRGASGHLSETSSLRSRSRRRRESGLYMNEPRVHFAPTPSPQPSARNSCPYLAPIKELKEDIDPSELSSEDEFEERGLYSSCGRKNYSPSQSMEGHPTPSQSHFGRSTSEFSEEGSTTATSYIIGSSPSVSLNRKYKLGTRFERPRRVISRVTRTSS